MQDYLEEKREKEELEIEKYEEEIERLENAVVDRFKDDVESLLKNIKEYMLERDYETGCDFGINEEYLLKYLLDSI